MGSGTTPFICKIVEKYAQSDSDIQLKMRTFANKWSNYELSISTSYDYNIYFASVEYFVGRGF